MLTVLFGDTPRKRAQWESFEFSVSADSLVIVINVSYGDDEKDEHVHTVDVEDGVPTSCTCKADEFGSGACKHRVAVAIRRPVLAAATQATQPRTAIADGGSVVSGSELLPEDAENADVGAGCSCPQDHSGCEGAEANVERPVLCWKCWERWSSL